MPQGAAGSLDVRCAARSESLMTRSLKTEDPIVVGMVDLATSPSKMGRLPRRSDFQWGRN